MQDNENRFAVNLNTAKVGIINMIKNDIENGMHSPTMLQGGAGIGKSSMGREIAKDIAKYLDREYLDLSDPKSRSDFEKKSKGKIDYSKYYFFIAWLPSTKDVESLYFPYLQDEEHGKKVRYAVTDELPPSFWDHPDFVGMLMIDEIGQADESVQKILMSLLLDRGFNGYILPDGVNIVGASNRAIDFAGVRPMLRTVKDRIVTIYDLKYDFESWYHNWGIDNIHSDILSYLRFTPDHLYTYEHKDVGINDKASTPRSIEFLNRVYTNKEYDEFKSLSKEEQSQLRTASYVGCVGWLVGQSFSNFLELRDQITIDPKDVLNDPEGTELIFHGDRDTDGYTCALIAQLVTMISTKTEFKNAITYLNRLQQKEYVVFFATYVARKNPDLAKGKFYNDFILENHID